MLQTPLPIGSTATARAFLLGGRLELAGLEAQHVLSRAPLAFLAGTQGLAVLFRYGVVVLINLTASEQESFLQSLSARVRGPFALREEETVNIALSETQDVNERPADDQIAPGGPIRLRAMSPERLLVVADAMAKSVVLAHGEREVASVFDVIEPVTSRLAKTGRTTGGRREMLSHIGNALAVQHRVTGHVAVAEKPDVLWDRPDLERLYARLEDEFELKERADILNRKLAVISDTAQALTDIIDTKRSHRLELIIVLLILFEVVMTLYQHFAGR